LDQLCEGRLILGLGRGLQKPMFEAFGVAAANKRALFAQHLALMRKAWRGESVVDVAEGEPVILSPLPVQRPEPPLWVAAFGPLALEQVAGLGLPYLASPLESLTTLQSNYRRYHEQVAEAGQQRVSTVPVMRTVHVCESSAKTRALREELAASVPPRMREQAGAVEEWAIVGEPAYVHDTLGRYRESLGLSHLIVRAGIRGVDPEAQMTSHERLLCICAEL